MAPTDLPPRFFKVYISHFSSDSMMIPISYNDELPSRLPKTAILQGSGGCSWKVAMKEKKDEIHFEKGWTKFVKDNSLVDGDFLTFVYNKDCVFEVSIYGLDGEKDTTRAVAAQVENEKEDNVISISSDEDTEMDITVPSSINKGKSKVVDEEDSDDTEDDEYLLSSDEDTDTCSDFEKDIVTPKTKNKGKKKLEDSESYDDDDDDDDKDYTEAFGRLDVSDDSNSDSCCSPDIEDTTAIVIPKTKNPKKKGFPVPGTRMSKVRPKIKNPEAYLDNPNNIHFETGVKNRKYELLVHAQLVKDYCLKFADHIDYIDKYGKLPAKTARWKDERVCIKRWIRICARNNLQRNDRVLCELLRKQNVVFAIKIHIVRARFLEEAVLV